MNAKLMDRIATITFYLIASLIMLLTASIIGYILIKGIRFLNWGFLTSPPQAILEGGGVGPQLFNSLYLLFLTMIISVPISIGAGIYMAKYAKQNFLTQLLRIIIETLSSLPSIVIGLFGFLLFVIYLDFGFSILSGALVLSIFNLPLMIRVVETALEAVPVSDMEGGLALGISKWETIRKILLPKAFPAILTGVILASGRIFGEAACLIYTAGMSSPTLNFLNWNPFSPDSPLNPLRPAETLAVHIWKINAEGLMPDVEAISNGAAALLILTILLFNLSARYLGNRLYRRMNAL